METLKDMEMTVSAIDPPYDVALVGREKREIAKETLWMETTFVAAGEIHCQIHAM